MKKEKIMCLISILILGSFNTISLRSNGLTRKNSHEIYNPPIGGLVSPERYNFVNPEDYNFKMSDEFENLSRDGVNTDYFTHEGSYRGNQIECRANNNTYGYAALNFASVYAYYDAYSDSAYIACLATTSISPVQTTGFKTGYYDRKMILDLSIEQHSSDANVKRVSYFPGTSEFTYSSATSFSIGASIGSSIGFSETGLSASVSKSFQPSISHTESVTYTSIESSAIVESTSQAKLRLQYDFMKTQDSTNRNNDACHKLVTQSYAAIFAIENYRSYTYSKGIIVKFKYTPVINHANWLGSSVYNEGVRGETCDKEFTLYVNH